MKKIILFCLPLILAGCLNQSAVKDKKESLLNTGNSISQVNDSSSLINSDLNINEAEKKPAAKEINVSLVLKFEDQEKNYQEVLEEGQTVFDLLVMAAAKENISLKFQNYQEMGVFITEINNIENGKDNKYWQYTINGKYAEKAADKMELKEGDMVSWEFKESKF